MNLSEHVNHHADRPWDLRLPRIPGVSQRTQAIFEGYQELFAPGMPDWANGDTWKLRGEFSAIALDVSGAEGRLVEIYDRQAALYARLYLDEPVLVNKLRGRATQTIFSLNDLVHPETIEKMTPKSPRVTSQPLYDDDWRAYGCGCVR